MVKTQPRHDVGVMKLPSGEFTTSTAQSLDLTMDNTFPGSEPVPPHHSHTVRLENDVQGAFTYPEYPFFSTDLIVESFKKFKNSKSPGPDKFKPRMLKHLPPIALDRLRQLY